MAKLPPNGSRRLAAQFVENRVKKKYGDTLRAIQPQILAELDGDFYWSVKVIDVQPAHANVGIARKYEAGFMIVKHGENPKKIREVLTVVKYEKKPEIPLVQ